MAPSSEKQEGSIRAIERASVHRICSGQVVLDLATCVKEILENALDAGASGLEIRLKEYGADLIEVADNGKGIRAEDYETVAAKYHTSKISCFEDVATVATYGFRGEALSSICAVADVTMTTRTADQEVGARLSFDHSGRIKERTCVARSVGTTVSVKELFKTLPVRLKGFRRNVKKEFAKLVSVLQAYALISTSTKFIATHQVKQAPRSTIVCTSGKPKLADNIACVLGAKIMSGLESISVGNSRFKISGFVSSANKSGSKGQMNRQFIFLNGRPIDQPKVLRLINDVFRSLSSPATAGVKAMIVLDLQMARDLCDVNVTPDKRTVMVQCEAELLELLRGALQDVWDPAKRQSIVDFQLNRNQTQIGLQQAANSRTEASGFSRETEADVRKYSGHVLEQSTELPNVSDMAQAQSQADQLAVLHVSPSSPSTALAGTDTSSAKGRLSLSTASKSSIPRRTKLAARLAGMVPCPSEGDACLDENRAVSDGAANVTKWSNGLIFRSPGRLDRHLCNGSCDDLSFGNVARKGTHGQDLQTAFCQVGLTSSNSGYTGQASPAATSLHIGISPTGAVSRESTVVDTAALEGSSVHGEQESPKADISPRLVGHRSTIADNDISTKKACPSASGRGGQQLAQACLAPVEHPTLMKKVMQSMPFNSDFQISDPVASPEVFKRSGNIKGTEGNVLDPIHVVSGNADLEASRSMSTSRPTGCSNLDVGHAKASDGGVRAQRLHVDMASIRARQQMQQSRVARGALEGSASSAFKTASLQAVSVHAPMDVTANEQATRELEHVFNKAKFKDMHIHGQFNLGFIMASVDSELFIIDQHAADERFNFERVRDTVELKRQPLLLPLALELSAVDAMTVTEHIEVFEQNGFTFVEDNPSGSLKLVTVPFSKDTTFGIDDVHELIALLQEGGAQRYAIGKKRSRGANGFGPATVPRPSKVQAMLAMRACRSSIMIGRALNASEMKQVVSHLAELDSPWTCAHGRPTMRHICSLH